MKAITDPRARRVRVAAAGGALALALFTAACGGHDSGNGNSADHNMGGQPSASAPRTGATFNGTDVKFATDMIPHHQQAVDMAKLAETKAATPAVKDLAARISKAQGPEIATMSGWLKAWGEPVPSAGAMDHGMDHSMPGMMSQQEMQQLAAASGTAFDKMFLTMMIKHHEGAVEMARTEQEKGADPAAKKLAADIATSQTAEIAEMKAMLAKL
ncbi:DUF305 domain-containing protein [Dactylosporangium fulvum]|uniref:DUF305 domain-containing protein n=1 Tax=Dactylosporangium fulvum TaxID=53359 RepID=A0ABY5VQX1_9ACTN|nr:DUF305 domain-containing protein [Dactylosporangium fulvum]UWP79580.1 DUF305 domain-containing protein [Dactylosporangium fulvum]